MCRDAFNTLLAKDGAFDQLITVGPNGAYQLISVYLKTWRMDTQGGILSDLIARGVGTSDTILGEQFRSQWENTLYIYVTYFPTG